VINTETLTGSRAISFPVRRLNLVFIDYPLIPHPASCSSQLPLLISHSIPIFSAGHL